MLMMESALVPLLVFCLLPVAKTSSLSITVKEDLWKADVLDLALVNASIYHCSLILLTDGDTSTHTIYQVLGSRGQGSTSGEVVFEVARDADGGNNFTHSLIPHMVAQAKMLRLLTWCMAVVVISDNPTFLAAFAEASDKGRLIVWTTKLVVVTKVNMHHLHSLLKDYWIFSRMNTVFIRLKDKPGIHSCQLYVYMPYSREGSQVVRVASWKSGHDLVFVPERSLFPEKYNNFYGSQVNLTWHYIKPYWTKVTRPGPNGTEIIDYTGREYSIISAMAEVLNFSMNPLPYKNWELVLRRLRTREALIFPVNLPILPHMLEDYDFTFFLERSTLAFSMAKPSIKPSWQNLYQPLTVPVWISILVSVLVVCAILMMMKHSSKGDGPSAWLVMKQVMGTLLDEAIPGELPMRDSTRVALTAWLIFSFIVGTVYRSNLTACLTVPKYPPRAENFAQLADSGAKITVVILMEIFNNSFKLSDSTVLKTIAERMVYVPSPKEGMTEALTENSAHLYERLYMEVMIEEHFTNRDGSTELYVTQESLLADFSAFLLIRDAPFKEKIDYCMMTFHTAGLIEKWKDNAMDDVRREGRQQRRKLETEDEETTVTREGFIKPLTMVHMQGPFLLYVVCVIVSFAAFLGEVARAPFLRHDQHDTVFQ